MKIRKLNFALLDDGAMEAAKALIRSRDTREEGTSSYNDPETGEEVSCAFWRGWTKGQYRSLTLHSGEHGNVLRCDFGDEGSLEFAAQVLEAMTDRAEVSLDYYLFVNPEPGFSPLERAAYEARWHRSNKEFAAAIRAAAE